MKTALYSVLLSFCFFSCDLAESVEQLLDSKNSNNLSESQAHARAIVPDASQISFTWEVVKYTDGHEDETYEVAGMKFSLLPGQQMAAWHLGQTAQGTWRFSQTAKKLVLRLQAPKKSELDELDDEWYIMHLSDTEMHLYDPEDKGHKPGEWFYLRKVADVVPGK